MAVRQILRYSIVILTLSLLKANCTPVPNFDGSQPENQRKLRNFFTEVADISSLTSPNGLTVEQVKAVNASLGRNLPEFRDAVIVYQIEPADRALGSPYFREITNTEIFDENTRYEFFYKVTQVLGMIDSFSIDSSNGRLQQYFSFQNGQLNRALIPARSDYHEELQHYVTNAGWFEEQRLLPAYIAIRPHHIQQIHYTRISAAHMFPASTLGKDKDPQR